MRLDLPTTASDQQLRAAAGGSSGNGPIVFVAGDSMLLLQGTFANLQDCGVTPQGRYRPPLFTLL